jgi:hypothetical protein
MHDPLAAAAGRSGGLPGDGTLVFRLHFTDGTEGIFTALVPEPHALGLLALSALAVLPRPRRRRRSR